MQQWLQDAFQEKPQVVQLRYEEANDPGREGQVQYDPACSQVRVHDGTEWKNASAVMVKAYANLPSDPATGTLAFVTDGVAQSGTGTMAVWDGSAWREIETNAAVTT